MNISKQTFISVLVGVILLVIFIVFMTKISTRIQTNANFDSQASTTLSLLKSEVAEASTTMYFVEGNLHQIDCLIEQGKLDCVLPGQQQ